MINVGYDKGNNRNVKYVFIQFLLFSNAVQSQARTILDVILEWFVLVIPKVDLGITFPNPNSWEEAIHSRTDWNFSTCKFRYIKPLIMVEVKIN
jgi:hypothetical protein